MEATAWTLIVVLPMMLLLGAIAQGWDVFQVAGAYLAFMIVLRIFSTQIFSKNLARVLASNDKNKEV